MGQGWDVHRIAPGRPLILGGIRIPCDFGLEGHSDADVLSHAITDALLGAAALGDIGMHFPDSDTQWKGCDSLVHEVISAAGLPPMYTAQPPAQSLAKPTDPPTPSPAVGKPPQKQSHPRVAGAEPQRSPSEAEETRRLAALPGASGSRRVE